jgi:hypothetical protein
MTPPAALHLIKVGHTLIWAIFAGCILAIPIFSHYGRFAVSAVLIILVAAEVLVLAFNRGGCPLTPLAARYTGDRRPNFDIYLPEWLARYNKEIFGPLYVFGVLYTLVRWF